MLPLRLDRDPGQGLEVLCLGAHCDDIEIGCGGTLLQLAANPENRIHCVVFASNPDREAEARGSLAAFMGNGATRTMTFGGFRDGFLPWSGGEVKDRFEALKSEFSPDLVLTHYRHDLHQDHRLVSELTWNTFRNHLVLEYEIPKWDGDLGVPDTFVHLDAATCDRKIELLLEHYGSQSGKPWFTADTFRALARIRGMESNAESGLAEAFHGRKSVLRP